MDLLEQLLDNNFTDLIDLYINGSSVKCSKYAILPIDEKIYFLLLPTTQVEGMDEGELIILYITRSDFNLKIVNDRSEFSLILDYYEKLISRQKAQD